MKLQQLAERDAWICWLCGNEVDANAVAGSAHAASMDHVVPKALGGDNSDSNLRLAHRSCNSGRGNKLPELHWPAFASTVDTSELWSVVRRLMKKPGSTEAVAFFADEADADKASSWVVGMATTITGEPWESEVVPMGATMAVRLRCNADSPHVL